MIAGGNTNGVWDYYSYGVGSLIGYAYSTVVTGVLPEKGTVAGGVGNSIGALLGVLNASSLTYSTPPMTSNHQRPGLSDKQRCYRGIGRQCLGGRRN